LAVAVGQAVSSVWCNKDEQGNPAGVTVELGRALGEWLNLPVEIVSHESSAHIVYTAPEDTWDLTFIPVDAERKKSVAFGPNYYMGVSTYGVRRQDPAHDLAGIDRAGCRIAGVEGTATLRSARRTLTKAEAIGVDKLNDAVSLFESGKVDAIALGKESLESLANSITDLRVLDGYYHATGTAVAVPLGHEADLELLARFVEMSKTNGLIAKLLEKHGLPVSGVAPVGSYS
jgi:polar amino acid transport system substrate-binding protein